MLKCRDGLSITGDSSLHVNSLSRSRFALFAIAAASACMLSGMAACHRSPSSDVVATVNGKEITPKVISKDQETQIELMLSNAAIGEGRQNTIVLNYKTKDKINFK